MLLRRNEFSDNDEGNGQSDDQGNGHDSATFIISNDGDDSRDGARESSQSRRNQRERGPTRAGLATDSGKENGRHEKHCANADQPHCSTTQRRLWKQSEMTN